MMRYCFFILFLLCQGCFSEKLDQHEVEKLIKLNKVYNGYRPFTDPQINKICLVNSGADLTRYGEEEDKDIYGYMVIIEYRSDGQSASFIKDSLLSHTFRFKDDGSAICTDQHEKIIMHWKGMWFLTWEKN